MTADPRKANRLSAEKSPYLQQHAYNPVDWYPWGEEALNRAAREDKPVFLSIGYSTCHWCHVMEKESFEDPEVGHLLNQYYVPIKVDREERPDLDQVYMNACQALTGAGGWPLTVILTPAGEPFFAATYLPKNSRRGMTGLLQLLPALSEAWRTDRGRVEQVTAAVKSYLQRGSVANEAEEMGSGRGFEELPDAAYRQFRELYDRTHGGFGGAPKFPAPHQLTFLLRYWQARGEKEALEMVVTSLEAMYRGGIFDQLGYGMHRYSVDQKWLVPHFEKMLYDQATTALAALEAWQATGEPMMGDFAGKILSYVLENLASPQGPFYAAEDADSEGEEGTFYVWCPEELNEALGPENGRLAADYFGVTSGGNFEQGKSVLHRPRDDRQFALERGLGADELTPRLEAARLGLLTARGRRERPFLDDKIITAWNGLLIAALARGAALRGGEGYLAAAEKAASFILAEMVTPEGLLLRRYREGEAAISAFLEDYSFMVRGLLELYRATFKGSYLLEARRLTVKMLDLFGKNPDGSLLFSAGGTVGPELPVEGEAYDGAHPSGVSVAVYNLLQLGRLLRDQALLEKGEQALAYYLRRAGRQLTGHAYLLSALLYDLEAPEELVIAGPPGGEETLNLANVARRVYRPQLDLLMRPTGEAVFNDPVFSLCPFLEEMTAPPDGAAAYYCRDRSCRPPVFGPGALEELLL